MQPTYHRTRDGQQVAQRDAFDERGILRDGYTMRTKLTLRDGVPVSMDAIHQQKSDRVAQYNARISDAWRDPPPAADQATAPAAVADVYERYDRRVADAWRS